MAEEEEEIGTEEENDEPVDKATDEIKIPSLAQNYITLVGITITVASVAGIVLLFLLELTAEKESPYLGILIYILLPGAMIFGFFVILLGIVIERRRRRKMSPEEIAAYPILDLNGPRRRRAFFAFLVGAFFFIMVSGFGSYRAYEFSESTTFCGETCHVMHPENTAYLASAHARVTCVECHVGGGADFYLKSKFEGVRQLFALMAGTYQEPIPTPVHNLRPAQDICEKCHWPEKFWGEQLKVFTHYGYDEKNTLNQSRLLIKTGGGSPTAGQTAGIHWHMNVANQVSYVATDDKRQDIAWVRFTESDGRIVDYTARDTTLTPEQIKAAPKRKMDCVDCHNRPAHVYLSPNSAVDRSFSANKLDRSLPFLKLKSVEVLSKPYKSTEEALATIAKDIHTYYKTNYGEIYDSKTESINAAVVELRRIYSTYFFPEMKTDWQSHTDNIGHYNAKGCYRCHDGRHVSPEGKTIQTSCNICHTTLDQTFGGRTIVPPDGNFQHPIDLGGQEKYKCADCHKGNRAFQHPINLGDISKFQCVECHKKK
ncbi:MAG: NapC/NirT family cytochrome c [Acidobacteriota bacterium]|nr:NapC/NirT family cytochrome c [Acidobacteriota bacterium]MDH3530077.1 NapC/NirT family cytochrome c [Acidobacteriota bacterium]